MPDSAIPRAWRILQILAKGEPLPTVAIAKMPGMLPVTVSKHINLMRRHGALARGCGRLYTIALPSAPPPVPTSSTSAPASSAWSLRLRNDPSRNDAEEVHRGAVVLTPA